MNLASILLRHATARPNHPAIVEGEVTLDHAAAAGLIARYAAHLARHGVGTGDRVGLALRDSCRSSPAPLRRGMARRDHRPGRLSLDGAGEDVGDARLRLSLHGAGTWRSGHGADGRRDVRAGVARRRGDRGRTGRRRKPAGHAVAVVRDHRAPERIAGLASRALRTMDRPMGGHRLQRHGPLSARHAALFRRRAVVRNELPGGRRNRDLRPAARDSSRDHRRGSRPADHRRCSWCRHRSGV